MPAATLNVERSASGQPKSSARVIAVIGRCSAVSSPAVYQFDSDTVVPASLGDGPLTELTMAISRIAQQRVIAVPCATTGVAGSLTAVTETPASTGPAVTVTGTPNDSLWVVVKIVRAGARGTAKFRVSLDDGLTYGPTLLTAATYLIPKTGITLEFGTGTDYIIETLYTFSSVAPAPSAAEIDAAISVLRASKKKFSMIVVAQADATAAETRSMANQLKTSMESARAARTYLRAILSAGVDVADADIVTAFDGIDAERVALAAGDCYLGGGNIKGSFRRPLGWAAAIKAARNRFSSDLGNGDDGSLDFIDDYTRDEFFEAVKLREDAHAIVLETRPGSEDGVFFSRGVTLAADHTANVYGDLNIARVMDEACRIVQPLLNQEVNNDPDTKPNGTVTDDYAEGVEAKLDNALQDGLIRTADGVKHASSALSKVDRNNVIATSEDLRIDLEVQKKAQNKTVTATIGISSTSSVETAAA
jgi:hypothetical protein